LIVVTGKLSVGAILPRERDPLYRRKSEAVMIERRKRGRFYIEPKINPGAYDREVFLVMKGVRTSLRPVKRPRSRSLSTTARSWTLNGEAFSTDSMKPLYTLHDGRRDRLKFRNASDGVHR
jgi:hypothetical protein